MRGETPIVHRYVYGASLQFDQNYSSFSTHFATMKFYKVELIATSSTAKAVRKITKMIQSIGFQKEFESFKSMKFSWLVLSLKVGTFSGLLGRPPTKFLIPC